VVGSRSLRISEDIIDGNFLDKRNANGGGIFRTFRLMTAAMIIGVLTKNDI
jgi:hypothetical protein